MKSTTRLVLRVSCILTTFICVAALAQQQQPAPQESKTKLESFQRQTGTVFVKGYSDIAKINSLGSVGVTAMEFTDATSKKRQTGIVIEVTEGGRLERSNRSFIDYDEIDPLLSGIDYIATVKPDATKLSNFEATYKTKGDLAVTTFSSSSGKIEATVKSGSIGAADAYISLQQLNQLSMAIQQAKSILDSLK